MVEQADEPGQFTGGDGVPAIGETRQAEVLSSRVIVSGAPLPRAMAVDGCRNIARRTTASVVIRKARCRIAWLTTFATSIREGGGCGRIHVRVELHHQAAASVRGSANRLAAADDLDVTVVE
ncbi:hypothetical protein [Nonomuraea sp. NPDC049141]|uniref:hypothetical protein n=1 Tax=Nonomuraea sp. NPDC049141 TaxID=3155500 RepID=UPI0033DA37AD